MAKKTQKKIIKKKYKPKKSRRRMGGCASWSGGHLNPILDSDRIEPENYTGENPYKKKHSKRHAKHHDAIIKKESKLYLDRRYHELVFENILAIEFVNLDEFSTDWITSIHRRFFHPKEFPIGDGSYYRWDTEEYIPEQISDGGDADVRSLIDIKDCVFERFTTFQSEIRAILIDSLLNKKNGKPILKIRENLGSLRIKCLESGLDLEWTTPFENFKHVILRDFVEFYYKHPYCLDLMVSCKHCGKFLIPTDPRKEYCDKTCREHFNNSVKARRASRKAKSI